MPRPASRRSPATAQAIQSSVTIAVVFTGTTRPGIAVATSQPPRCGLTSSLQRSWNPHESPVAVSVERAGYRCVTPVSASVFSSPCVSYT
jgi:hypothetical protein